MLNVSKTAEYAKAPGALAVISEQDLDVAPALVVPNVRH